jgi:hypothetical protein
LILVLLADGEARKAWLNTTRGIGTGGGGGSELDERGGLGELSTTTPGREMMILTGPNQ